MNIAILTLTGHGNFGNRLQNFALQESLKALGADRVDTIKSTHRTGEGGRAISRRAERLRTSGMKSVADWLACKVNRPSGPPTASPTHRLGTDRQNAISDFVGKYLCETPSECSDVATAREIVTDYDFFVAGSDQIWNPHFGLRDHLRFLEFANPAQRIAYAASFGVAELPRHLKKTYQYGIAGFAHVSVREQRAAEIVRELTGREVPVVLDPTMLLEPAEWESLAVVPPSLTDAEHVAEFFLGSATDDEMLPVRQLAANRGLGWVDLKSDAREDFATMGPLEFIGAIKASNLLVTDSFHAAVFATIFRVPYLLKGRGAMNSRFDTLLSKSGLPMPKWVTLKEIEASIDIDWDSVHQNIARERVDSLAYLRTALSVVTGA